MGSKEKKQQRFLRFCACSLLAAGLLAVSGCASPEPPGFTAVASQLDRGGCYYRISDNGELFNAVGKIFRSLERALHNSSQPGSFEKDQFLAAASMLELAVRLSGVSECRWSGASSIRIPDALEPTFRSRSFFLLPEDSRGAVWRLPGTENRPLFKELAGLPSDTVAAGDFILDLRPLGEMLEKSSLGQEWADTHFRMIFGASLRKTFERLSGEWGFVLFPRPGDSSFDFVITFPDREKQLFSRFCVLFKRQQAGKNNENTLLIPLGARGMTLICQYDAGRITVYSGENARKRFLSSDEGLGRQPDFKRLSHGMPGEGLGIFYFAGVQPETREVDIPLGNGVASIDQALYDRPRLIVLRREKNGLSLTSQGEFDLQTSDMMNLILVPALCLLENKELWSDVLPRKTVPAAGASKSVQPKEDPVQKNIRLCSGNLEKLAGLLKAYAARSKGEYPREMDIEGVKKLLPADKASLKLLICPGTRDEAVASAELLDFNSCSYLYFGSWKKGSSGKLPLFVDRPGNHTESFHVLFNDGTVELFKLENCESIKRMAGFLHTRYQYSEDEFRELIQRASRLDGLFDAR